MAEATAATIVPTFNDVLAARERISRYLQPTALNRYPALDELIGTETWVKHENNQPVCDFKVGGGSGAAGTCMVAKAVNAKIQVIGVQSAEAPAGYKSWRAHRLLEDRMGTIAEGLATRTAFEMPQRILWEMLDDFVLVPAAEIRTAVRLMIETTRNLAEPAGAAPLAAALQLRERLRGKRVALILSGSNITPTQLRELVA